MAPCDFSRLFSIIFLFFLYSLSVFGDGEGVEGGEADGNYDPLIVTISSGKIKGKVLKDREGGEFYAFQKIPYGKPPLGDLRFKPLQPPDPWNATLDATQIAPDCLQDSKGFSTEDCIYLNVFTHRDPELHPVMVYIYGGALTSGSSNPETTLGPEFLLTRDVVLVTINYRLGVLGFLNYEHPSDPSVKREIASNNGFKDQVCALKWIQDHVEHFGGDANQVTIFGNSAGAVSVHALLLSPLTENLFHRAIVQSGTAITRGLAMNNSAVYVGEVLGFDTSNGTELIKALRGLSERDILDLQDKIDVYRLTINKMTPAGLVIEEPGPDSFMTSNPWSLIKSGRYHRRPVIFGFLNSEGIIYYVYRFLKNTTRYFDISAFVPYYYKQREFAALEIDQDFFPTQNYTDIAAWVEVWGYSSFIFDIVRCVLETIEYANVWFYQFELDTVLNWSKARAPEAFEVKGACHGDELGYLFRRSTTPAIRDDSEEDLAIERMVTMWTNFAIYGMPVVGNDTLFDGEQWHPVREDRFNMFKIGRQLSQEVYDTSESDYWKGLYEVFSTREL